MAAQTAIEFGKPEAFFARHAEAYTNPFLIKETLAVLRDPACSAASLVKVLEREPGASSKILKAANSVFFGTPKSITSLKPAIVRLGNHNVSRIALAAALGAAGSAKWTHFWRHSISAAMLSRHIAGFLKSFSPQEEEEFFSMGLLHDLGLMVEIASGGFFEVEQRMAGQSMTVCEAEREVFGFDHAALGRIVAERWNFPGDLVDAIACHHRPESSGEFYRKVAVIHLADVVCHGYRFRNADDEAPPPTAEAYLQELNLPVEQLILFGDWLLGKQAEIDAFGQLMGG